MTLALSLVFALLFHGVWGVRLGLEENNLRRALVGVALLVFGVLFAIARGLYW
jgi:hypothetical protein